MIDTKELRKLVHRHAQAALSIPIKPAMLSEILDRLEAAEKERDDVAQQLVQSEVGKRGISEAHNVAKRRLSALAGENTVLQAKIAEMERQEPVWFIDERGEPKRYHRSKADYCKYGGLDLLYALPGAKGEEK